ncbi:MAG: hypothetical protein ABI254_05635, partial [Chthoniobacterales bacterium]
MQPKRIWVSMLCCAIVLICATCAFAEDIPSATIDLRQPPTLKMLFDGGLRPYRLQGLESLRCDTRKYKFRLILPTASPVDFPVNRSSFSLLADNVVSSI